MSYDLKGRATDAISEAVTEAIDAGMTPREFVVAAYGAWSTDLRERGRTADSDFGKLLAAKTKT